MELTNEFRVDTDPATTWSVLTDLERIAPCMPGAELQEVEGDEYRGIVRVKVGPISAQYKGSASFVELDAENRKAVVSASGRDTRGQGNASATITATLMPDGGGTRVFVVTDLTVTGKVAQFGRGVMADISAKLLDQFVVSLESTVLRGPLLAAEPPAAGAGGQNRPAVRRIESAPAAPVNLLDAAGSPLMKRLGPLLGGLFALVLLRRWLRRRT